MKNQQLPNSGHFGYCIVTANRNLNPDPDDPFRPRGPFDERRGPGPHHHGEDGRFGRGGPGMGPGLRDIRLSSETQSLFDDSRTNAFYYAVWTRGGSFLKISSNAPVNLVLPESSRSDTRPHTFNRDT